MHTLFVYIFINYHYILYTTATTIYYILIILLYILYYLYVYLLYTTSYWNCRVHIIILSSTSDLRLWKSPPTPPGICMIFSQSENSFEFQTNGFNVYINTNRGCCRQKIIFVTGNPRMTRKCFYTYTYLCYIFCYI